MPVDSIVRVSFQSSSAANHAADLALVGDSLHRTGRGPFRKVNTACYSCSDASESAVAAALARLSQVLQDHTPALDFVSITLTRHGTSDVVRRVEEKFHSLFGD